MSAARSCALIVVTRNEGVHLRRCLESVTGLAQEVFVVDSGSTDDTCAIARELGAHVVTHEFVDQGSQFNWALNSLEIESEWILRLDADEFLLPELRDEIIQVLSGAPVDITGYQMKRRVYFHGRWIRHGGYYPVWLLRLFRRGCARSDARAMDERMLLNCGRVARLRHDFVDMNARDLRFFTLKHEEYAGREASALVTAPVTRRPFAHAIYTRSPLFWRAMAYFLYRYIFQLGFLDGREGLVFHVLQGFWYRFYVDAKLWESSQCGGALS